MRETFTDVELFYDGSGKALWRVVWGVRTWRAGVADSMKDAQAQAEAHLEILQAELATRKRVLRQLEEEQTMLDLDKLDREGE